MVAHRYIISTTDRWSSNAEAALANQIIETSRIGIADIASALLNWDVAFPGSEIQVKLERKKAFQPLNHFGKGLSVSCKIKLHSPVDDLPDPRSVWFR
ncbi:hypothetical protein QP928_09945 [Corynebacterium propinquum]|uniref:restriction endonuclease n=1 Tax=Corynebacterium propinquum TaxID=43769 RepID=UPI00254B3AE2|nr:hypothetical protein [Corynebacterium propinquum]MDK8666866.1 hypothetical protein [Corynebacterium propinquum]